jgi:hypothetical protein
VGTFFKVSKLDDVLHHLNSEPIFLDTIDTSTVEGKRIANDLLYAKYTDGIIDVAMSCSCGMLTTNKYHGKRCNYCNTIVESKVDRLLEARLWYRKPECINKLFNPIAWVMLSANLSIGNFNLISYFCDRSRTLDLKSSNAEKYIRELPFERGFNNFVDNFEEIVDALVVPRVISGISKREAFKEWFSRYKDDLLVDDIPLPNRDFVVMEQTGSAKFAQATNTSAIDAIRTLSKIDDNIYKMNDARVERRLVAFYEQITDYYDATFANFMGKKKGVLRKNVYGEILVFTARAVVTSICGPHRHDEIQLPWALSLRLFRIHIISRLRAKYQFSPNQMEEILSRAVNYLDPMIIEIFEELLASAKDGAIHLIIGRNPTIYKGSINAVRCRKIKYDLNDYTIGCPILITKPMNMDFDGDEINVTLSLDNKFTEAIQSFAPHTNVLDEAKCWEVSNNIGFTAPLIANINRYLIDRGMSQGD